jgi:hypothetical protein
MSGGQNARARGKPVRLAQMGRPRSISDLVAQLQELPLPELRHEWRAAHPGLAMPKGLPRDLMVRSIAWQEQCARYGGISSATEQRLAEMVRQLAVSGTLEIERSVRPKTGTRMLREWRGRTYVVEVADDGFLHDGSKFASLSHVARAITGTRWSGPRFFGLKPEVVVTGAGEG